MKNKLKKSHYLKIMHPHVKIVPPNLTPGEAIPIREPMILKVKTCSLGPLGTISTFETACR